MSRTTAIDEETTTVELPAHVVEGVEDRLGHTDFEDADAYVAFVLEEVLASVEDGEGANYDAVDQDEVENRLQSLGYLDE